MALVAMDQIVAGRNARTVPVPAAAEEGLRRSIAAQGVLQPVLLRPLSYRGDPGFEIVLGSRRFRAAQAAGRTEIPAEIRMMSDVEVEEAQIAENVQRQAMHPVDQWRAVRELVQDHGLTFEQAGGALGLDDRLMRRMEQLGRLNPTLLKLAEIEMPTPAQLRKIAAAPAKLQAQAAKIKDLIIARGEQEAVDWHRVVMHCEQRRITRGVAIFDVTDKGLVWDEDLFAEPGAADQFTTADTDGFIRRQTKALQVQVAEAVKARKRHQMATMKTAWSVAIPSGYKESFGNPQRLKANEWAFHAVAEDGTIKIATGIDTKAAKAAEAKKAAKAGPAGSGDRAAADPGDDDADDDGDDDAPGGDAPAGDAAPVKAEGRGPFSKRGQALIAGAKDDAVRKTLDETPMGPGQVIALLVLALNADNVSFGGVEDARFDDLALRLLAPGGNLLQLSDADLIAIGQTALGRMLRFDVPDTKWRASSGAAAEWIGAAINAGAALERFDTADFLETASLAELKRAAAGAGLLTSGTAKALRERLVGRAPDYRPEAAQFGAPAPKESARV